MKQRTFALGILLLALSLAPQTALASDQEQPSATPDQACEKSTLLSDAEKLAKSGHWVKARDAFLIACRQDPANAQALHDLAVTYAHTGDLSQAAECERKALTIDEKYVPSHIELAYVLVKQDDRDGAREHLVRALELEPGNKIALKNLQAIMNLSRFRKPAPSMPLQQRTAAAEVQKTAVLASETDVSRALVARGASAYRQGKYDVARRFYEQALENCPGSIAARASLGVVRGTTGDIEGQIEEERLALQTKPKDAGALCNLAWALAQKGDCREALLSYQKALETNPGMVEAQAGQGILLKSLAKPEAALAVLSESVRQNPEKALLHLSLAVVLQSMERKEEALSEFEAALRLSPNNLEVKSRLAEACLAWDKFDRARELYAQLTEHTPTNAEFHIGLGLALTKQNEISAAYQQFKKAVELDKNLAAANACLSMIEEMKGCFLQAEHQARLAQEKDPDCTFFKESAERLAGGGKESNM